MGRNIIKRVVVFGLLIGAFLLLKPAPDFGGIVVPHHLFVSNYIDQLYQMVADDEVERVIVLSPNHFYQGRGGIISSDVDFGDVASIEPGVFPLEHGVMVQLPYIEKYFPNAKVVPIIFKAGEVEEEDIDRLVEYIVGDDSRETFVVASVDFTHYVKEAIAAENDRETVGWFEQWDGGLNDDFNLFELQLLAESPREDPDRVAIDSAESIYALLKFGFKNFQLVRRSSVNSLTGLDVAANNTSHIFAIFD